VTAIFYFTVTLLKCSGCIF